LVASHALAVFPAAAVPLPNDAEGALGRSRVKAPRIFRRRAVNVELRSEGGHHVELGEQKHAGSAPGRI
jgi:hypothetical protein